MRSSQSKRHRREFLSALPALLLLLSFLSAARLHADTDNELYLKHCAECHGADRLGGQGPALLPENLHRLRPKKAHKTIAEGRAATQMPPFSDR
ncbi:MAG: cytochrome c, partial [Candidatus Thiodiazotropha sp.]